MYVRVVAKSYYVHTCLAIIVPTGSLHGCLCLYFGILLKHSKSNTSLNNEALEYSNTGKLLYNIHVNTGTSD